MGETETKQEVKEVPTALQELPKAKVDVLNLNTFDAVDKVKSIRRAIRRGRVAPMGILYPERPFNNRKNKPLEAVKRNIYHGIKQSQSRAIATA